jgi:hypothetical protein
LEFVEAEVRDAAPAGDHLAREAGAAPRLLITFVAPSPNPEARLFFRLKVERF